MPHQLVRNEHAKSVRIIVVLMGRPLLFSACHFFYKQSYDKDSSGSQHELGFQDLAENCISFSSAINDNYHLPWIGQYSRTTALKINSEWCLSTLYVPRKGSPGEPLPNSRIMKQVYETQL